MGVCGLMGWWVRVRVSLVLREHLLLLHLQVELLVVVVHRVLRHRHLRDVVHVVRVAHRVLALLPPHRLGRLQRLVCNPEQLAVIVEVHANVVRVRDDVVERRGEAPRLAAQQQARRKPLARVGRAGGAGGQVRRGLALLNLKEVYPQS